MHLWVVYAHILGALLFMLAHGASAAVLVVLLSERDPVKVRVLLQLSQLTVGPAYIALLVLIVAGVWAGIEIQAFSSGQLWLWAAVVVLVVVLAGMYSTMSPVYGRVRQVLGDGSTEVNRAELDRALSSRAPLIGAVIGLVGILVILWLMVLKPF
jgi:hypothetical protein